MNAINSFPDILRAIAFLVWKYFRKSKIVLFGAAFFLITIILVLQLLPVGDALYADRYTYIPSIGLFFIASYFLVQHLKNKIVMTIAAAYIFWLCYAAFQNTKAWHDSITLYTHAINNGHKAGILYNMRGVLLSEADRNEEALSDFTSLVKLKPRYPSGWRNKGLIEIRLKQKEEAIKSFTEAIRYDPADANNYLSRGSLLEEKNDFEGAIKDFSKTIELKPNSGEAYYARSQAFGKSNRLTEARADINKAIEYSPGNWQVYNNSGIIFIMSGKFQEAVNDFTMSLKLKPDNLGAYTNRALANKGLGKYAEALKDMLTAKEKGIAVDENMINELKRLAGK